MQEEISKIKLLTVHKLLNEFIQALNEENTEELKNKFGITDGIYEEIIEILGYYYGEEIPKFGILSFNSIFRDLGSRKALEIYRIDDTDSIWRMELSILVNDKIDEPIFHFEVCINGEDITLQYLYVGS